MMSANEMFIKILHILSLTQIVSPTCNNGWTDYTTCPAPLTLLADGIKQLKSDLSKLNCQVRFSGHNFYLVRHQTKYTSPVLDRRPAR